MSAIKHCDCTSEYQDKIYGKQRRVHNEKATEDRKIQEYRCTVCGKVK